MIVHKEFYYAGSVICGLTKKSPSPTCALKRLVRQLKFPLLTINELPTYMIVYSVFTPITSMENHHFVPLWKNMDPR